MKQFFPTVPQIRYEGPESDNPLAFRHYKADQVIMGKTMARNMRTPNGTFEQSVEFSLPPTSKPGTYTLKTVISTGYGRDEKSVEFRVD